MLDQFLLTIAYFEHAEKPVAFRIGRQTGIRESVRQTATQSILMLGSGNGDSVISTLREIPSHAQPLTTA